MNANRRSRFEPAFTSFGSNDIRKADAEILKNSIGSAPNSMTKQEETVATLITLYLSLFLDVAAKKLMSHVVDPLKVTQSPSDINKPQLAALIDLAVDDYLDLLEEEITENADDEYDDNLAFSASDIELINDISLISGEEFLKSAKSPFYQYILDLALEIYGK